MGLFERLANGRGRPWLARLCVNLSIFLLLFCICKPFLFQHCLFLLKLNKNKQTFMLYCEPTHSLARAISELEHSTSSGATTKTETAELVDLLPLPAFIGHRHHLLCYVHVTSRR